MSYYSIESWTIRNVANAFNFKETAVHETDRKVVIPIFQRGLRWDPQRRRTFIDSLENGYPFGSLLFATQEGTNKFSVVDGLQRGSTVCDYVFNPLGKDNITKIDKNALDAIRLAIFPESTNVTINKDIEKIILDYFHEKRQFEKITMLDLIGRLLDQFPTEQDKFSLAQKLQDAFNPYLEEYKKRYNNICDSSVPIVIYSGPQELLNEIFNRINTKGIALNDYEIYAATWSPQKYKVNDTDVVEHVIKKYWALSDIGYVVDGFDATEMRTSKNLTAFEFLFGLGKLWTDKYDCLKFQATGKEDEINETAFEIVDACVNPSKGISKLDKRLRSFDINTLKRRIEEAILFVSDAIAVVGSFKGNKRKYNVLHSKYQIISLIAYTFNAMYDLSDISKKRKEWTSEREKQLSKLLLSHYVADIISNEWHDGGGAKVYSFIKEKKYEEEISKRRWELLLDNYYQSQLQNKQRDRFSNPVNADSVILNCIYVSLFSAADHISTEKKFDIEHLATKERMKNIMQPFDDLRLPIACIANLCYLPEDINRGKREKTIYEATSLSLPISEIENKYSFTTEHDLKWISLPYSSDERDVLVNNYNNYLEKRFSVIKKKFIGFFFPEN